MKYDEMTKRDQRLSRESICPICKKPIDKFNDTQIVKIRVGRRVLPSFIHTECILASLSLVN